MLKDTRELLVKAPSVLIDFLRHRRDAHLQSSLWSRILSILASEKGIGERVLPVLLLAVEQNQLPDTLHPEDDELDTLVIEIVEKLLDDCETEMLSIVRVLLQHPGNSEFPYSTSHILK